MPDKFVWFEFDNISEKEMEKLEEEAKIIAGENGREDPIDSDWLQALDKADKIKQEEIENWQRRRRGFDPFWDYYLKEKMRSL